MISKIDSVLFHYAGWLIKVAAFFGISRWQLIVIWVYLSSLLLPLPSGLLKYPELTGLVGLVAIILINTTMTMEVPACFRSDNVMGPSRLIRHPVFRITTLYLFILIGSTFIFIPSSKPLMLPLFFAKTAFPHYFWPWFCLHQNLKDPVTLRQLVRTGISKLRTALTPTPQPRLAPQPAVFSAPPT